VPPNEQHAFYLHGKAWISSRSCSLHFNSKDVENVPSEMLFEEPMDSTDSMILLLTFDKEKTSENGNMQSN
jgi:hypothetical protein